MENHDINKYKSHWPKQWLWKRIPDPKVQDGIITASIFPYYDEHTYCPANYRTDILNSIQKVYDEQSAVEFVKQWGMLGFSLGSGIYTLKTSIESITDYIYLKEKGINSNGRDFDTQKHNKIIKQVINDFIKGYENIEVTEADNTYMAKDKPIGLRVSIADTDYYINAKGDILKDVIDFAENIKRISEMKWLLNLFIDDPYVACFETAEWVKKHYYSFYTEIERNFLFEEIPEGMEDERSYKFYLTAKLALLRRDFSSKENRSVYLKVTPHGHPVLHFDALWCFILFNQLTKDDEPKLKPTKCMDPKCGQLFFKNRAGQKYCPPNPREKRSRCEQRHGKALRREAKKEKPGELTPRS